MGIPSIPTGPGVMSRSVDAEVYLWCIVTAPIVTVTTALRFWATRRSGRKIDKEDWFALAAGLLHIAYCAILAWDVAFINGRDPMKMPPSDLIYAGKLTYAAVPFFPVNQFFAKFSILFLYYRLFRINRTFVRWMWLWGGLQIIYSVATVFVSIFICSPVNKGWNPAIEGSCIDHNQYLAGSETVNSSVDFGMVAMAVWMIQGLKIRSALKWKLAILFAVGGAAGVIGFVKIGEVYAGTSVFNLESGIWTTIQQAASCVCCCAPVFGSLLPNTEWVRRHFGSRSKGSKPRSSQGSKNVELMSTSEERIASGAYQGQTPTGDDYRWDDDARGSSWAEVRSTPPLDPRTDLTVPARTINVKRSVDMVRDDFDVKSPV